MSRFLSQKFQNLEAYVPGEQPKDQKYIKLNTNESPFAPSPKIKENIDGVAIDKLRLYCDTDASKVRQGIAKFYNVDIKNVLICNGSDESLSFCFSAFCDSKKGIAFADVTYGLYKILGAYYNLDCEIIPLKEDFTIDVNDYLNKDKNIIIANPNAPTGIFLPLSEIEKILKSNPDNIVIIDEAYIDFGGESAVKLIKNYDNLIVIQTFSKSRSLAGARLGFIIANESLIEDLNKIRCSINPYNINALSQIAGEFAINDVDYFKGNAEKIINTRANTKKALEDLGFEVLNSSTNFLFAKYKDFSGEYFYKGLKEKGILVRYFSADRTKDYIRITIGTDDDMSAFIKEIKELIK
jgi:histidinol-phosphate aminotransferase